MTMGTKVYTKQCMYSLKQSHGAVEKNVVYMFSQKNEKEGRRTAVLQCVTGLLTWRMRHYFGICDTGMFSLTVMLCDKDDDRGREC